MKKVLVCFVDQSLPQKPINMIVCDDVGLVAQEMGTGAPPLVELQLNNPNLEMELHHSTGLKVVKVPSIKIPYAALIKKMDLEVEPLSELEEQRLKKKQDAAGTAD